MSASVLYMSMSLDGYIAGPNDGPDNPGGDGFDAAARVVRVDFGRGSAGRRGRPGSCRRDADATGAVLAGRRTVSRSITGAAIITASRSSCPVTGRRARRSRTIRW